MAEHTRIDTTTEDASAPYNPGLLWDPAVGISELNADGSTSVIISPAGVPGSITPQAAPPALTDSTGGAADTTLDADPAALTDSTGGAPASTLVAVRSDTAAHTAADANADFASLNAQLNATAVVLRDNIASVNAQVNTLIEALQDAGVLT